MEVRRRLLWVVVTLTCVVAAAVGLAVARSENDVQSGAPGGTASPPVGDTLPLLGVEGEAPRRAALAVKIDNTERGRPPSGVVEADVVFEEVVEGGLTRLMAVYQSDDPDIVGPVRSARSTDLSILAELGRPLFAWSGANPTFRALVENADLIDVGAAAARDAYQRDPRRPAPYNLYASPEELRSAAADTDPDASTVPPQPLFTYRAPGTPLAGPDVVTTTGYRTSGSESLATSIEWDWDPATQTWLRTQNGTPHVDRDGTGVAATNVIIRSTAYRDSGVRDSTGAVVPEAAMVGEGEALLLSGGQAQPGRWTKASLDAPTVYTALDGSPLRLAPGRTWVEVLPPGVGTLR